MDRAPVRQEWGVYIHSQWARSGRASIGVSLVAYYYMLNLNYACLDDHGDEVCLVTRAAYWRFQVCGCHGNGPRAVISYNTSAHDLAQSDVDQFHRFVNPSVKLLYTLLFFEVWHKFIVTKQRLLCADFHSELIHIANTVDIHTTNNLELSMQVHSDIANSRLFFTDLNGFQVKIRYINVPL